MKPLATTSAAVSEYIDTMKKDLLNAEFGKVGIVFTIDHGQVTYVQEVREKRYALTKVGISFAKTVDYDE